MSKLEKAELKDLDRKSKPIPVCFNPKEFSVDKQATWKAKTGKVCDEPDQEFTTPAPATLSVTLQFDTYEDKKSVYTEYIEKLEKLVTIISNTDKAKQHPPLCAFSWNKFVFQGVMETLNVKYTMFLCDGTPVRCEATIKMKKSGKATSPEPTSAAAAAASAEAGAGAAAGAAATATATAGAAASAGTSALAKARAAAAAAAGAAGKVQAGVGMASSAVSAIQAGPTALLSFAAGAAGGMIGGIAGAAIGAGTKVAQGDYMGGLGDGASYAGGFVSGDQKVTVNNITQYNITNDNSQTNIDNSQTNVDNSQTNVTINENSPPPSKTGGGGHKSPPKKTQSTPPKPPATSTSTPLPKCDPVDDPSQLMSMAPKKDN